MKTLTLLFIGFLFIPFAQGQDITDAVRYSTGTIDGTARFRAMSGAFGALGGDMSAVSLNPAGSSIFNSSHLSMSISNENLDHDTNYLGTLANNSNSNFDFNQAGGAFVFYNHNSNSPWKKFALGFSYNQMDNYDDDWLALGTNTTSIDRYFLDITETIQIPFGTIKLLPGEYLEEAYADIGATFGFAHQQVFLGYWAGIIDPNNLDDNTNNDEINYSSNISPGTFNQDYYYNTSGYNGKASFNFSSQYQDNFYFGINLNSHFIDYDRFTSFVENNINTGSVVNELIFENGLYTRGNGFSFQLGAITKLNDNIRLGFIYDSPTWYRFEEELIQNISSNNADVDIEFISTVLNVYPDYKLRTPGKLTGSFAYVFGKKGVISFDYSRKDFSNTTFRPTSDPFLSQQNSIIENSLTTASTYKVGGELKQKQWSFRGGYKFEESPYENTAFYGDLEGYSLGLGYNFGNTKLDFAYENSNRTISQRLFSGSAGFTDSAQIDTSNSNFILSLSFNL